MQSQEKTNVLIVEDDFFVSEVIQTEIQALGYNVVGKASNGQQAMEMAQTLQPDIILMDIEMPDMDGLEATQHISRRHPTPIVILTAYETPELVSRAGQAGAGAYLVKMPKSREIERAITIAIARFEDMMALRSLNQELESRNEELQTALSKVKQLSGLLPICAGCKKIRDDHGYWQQVEVYIRDHSEAEFSHGFCPDCLKRLYPDIFDDDDF